MEQYQQEDQLRRDLSKAFQDSLNHGQMVADMKRSGSYLHDYEEE